MNKRTKEIEELIQSWAEHGIVAFQGKARTKLVEAQISEMLTNAFKAGRQFVSGLGGQKFYIVWGDENKISVHQGEIPKGAFTIKV